MHVAARFSIVHENGAVYGPFDRKSLNESLRAMSGRFYVVPLDGYPLLVAAAWRAISALSALGAPNCEAAKELRAALRTSESEGR